MPAEAPFSLLAESYQRRSRSLRAEGNDVGRRIAAVVIAALAGFAASPAAHASARATLSARDLPLAGSRASARFDLVGLHWLGGGAVSFRTLSVDGHWSSWRIADRADGVHAGGWRFGEPYWTGPSNRLEWRATSLVRRVRAYFVRSPALDAASRSVASAGAPRFVLRSAWDADEKIRRGAPRYTPAARFAVIHHTAGTNAYGPADSAAIVRGIEIYHVKANGWNDIGYNVLVDRYGQVFEGRYGGITRNVIGAHAGGFNVGSIGVAVIGTYGRRSMSPAARSALVRLLAWRLDVAHVDPLSTVVRVSRGNSKYPEGTRVRLRSLSGHRDTNATDCPGDALYSELPSIATAVASTGLPKLYEPGVSGELGGAIVFAARLSSAQTWTVTVRDPGGGAVALGSGTGSSVRWVWNSAGAKGSSYTWAIAAGPSVRPATGTIGQATPAPPLPPVLTDFTASPGGISPDGDGHDDFVSVTYRLHRPALVSATVLDGAGSPVASLFTLQRQSARVQSWNWTADAVPDGRYTLQIDARDEQGRTVRVSAALLVDRTLGFLRADPQIFSPNGDGALDTITFSFDLGAPAKVAVQVVQAGREVALVFAGDLQPGHQQFVWNGQTPTGTVPDGGYDFVVTALDALAESQQSARFTVDSSAR
jgi:hypothetical protein